MVPSVEHIAQSVYTNRPTTSEPGFNRKYDAWSLMGEMNGSFFNMFQVHKKTHGTESKKKSLRANHTKKSTSAYDTSTLCGALA